LCKKKKVVEKHEIATCSVGGNERERPKNEMKKYKGQKVVRIK